MSLAPSPDSTTMPPMPSVPTIVPEGLYTEAKRRARPKAKRDARLRRLGDAEGPPEPCDPGFPNCCADQVLCVMCAKAGGRVVFGLRADGVLTARFTKSGA